MTLLIYGAGGLAKEVYDLAVRNYRDRYDTICFIDDYADEGSFYFSERVRFSSLEKIIGEKTACVEGIVAVGEPAYRKMLAEKFENAGIPLATLIDRTAVVSPSAVIEEGCIVCEQALVHAEAKIGKGVLIQPLSAVGHGSEIGCYSVISSGCVICGDVEIGNATYLGVNAAVREKLRIGANVIVAMGAVLFSDVEENNTVVGNPARVTRGNQNHRVFS